MRVELLSDASGVIGAMDWMMIVTLPLGGSGAARGGLLL